MNQIHSLWYTPSRSLAHAASHIENPSSEPNSQGQGTNQSRQRGQVIERTFLHRLATDEFISSRRRHNVANFGSHWLKPPGVHKTLHQMREEKREQEEHQEALRREQLAQELADAEAEAAGMGGEEEGMDDVQLDGAQDLDDEIPDAGDDFFAGGDSDEDEEDRDDDEGDEEDEDDEVDEEAIRAERQNDLIAARMRMTDDAFREAIARGDPDGEDMYGGDEELEEEHQGHMLDETDFVNDGTEDDMGIDMDADLDDEIPEAESPGYGYEHTDSEAELSSSEKSESGDDNYGDCDAEGDSSHFAPRATPIGPPQSPTLRSRSGQFASRGSMEFSALLSQDGSSFMDSSPAQGRRARQ